MKTTVHKLALSMAALLGLFSCDEKHEGELINDKEAKINAFQANGIDGIIDEEKTNHYCLRSLVGYAYQYVHLPQLARGSYLSA